MHVLKYMRTQQAGSPKIEYDGTRNDMKKEIFMKLIRVKGAWRTIKDLG